MNMKMAVTWPLARSCFEKLSTNGFRGVHPLGERPFALSAAASEAVEGFHQFHLPFLGGRKVLRPEHY